MLSLYQRLMLGCVLLLAILVSLSVAVRSSLHRTMALDAQMSAAARATEVLTGLQVAMAHEALLASHAGSGPGRSALKNAMQATQQRIDQAANDAAGTVPTAELFSLGQQHAALLKRVDVEDALVLSTRIEALNASLTQTLQGMSTNGAATATAADSQKVTLRLRLFTLTTLSILASILVAVVTVIAVMLPLRRTAQSAKRIGDGNVQQRLDWRARDDLGTIAAEFNRMAVLVRDLRETESGRRQMEHQLSDAVVHSIFEPVIVTDAKGHVLKLNRAAEELLGAAAGDRMALATTPGGDKILGAVRSAVAMQRAQAAEGDAALLPMKVGSAQRSYRLRTTPMRDAEGKLLGAVTVLEDVTEMQNLDRYKTRFLDVASKKLQGPLQKLRMGLYALSRGYAGEIRPLQLDLVLGAQEETEKMNDLMADLIEVGELESGRRELKIERLRPIELLRDSMMRCREDARAKNIQLSVDAFEDTAYVNADRRAVRTILDNLLSNALRYTPAEGEIRLEATELKDRVQFFVRDSGRGIEADRLATIFGRFSAASHEGTGLGLALVRRLVESLGGQVSVESRVGHGTTFSFTLPIASVTSTRHPVEIG